MENLKFPIGRPNLKENYSYSEIQFAISEIEEFPIKLEEQLSKLSPNQLKNPYRPGGWTGIQVVHHVADSHIHAYTRTKFALLNDGAPILGYEESDWAKTPEISSVDIEVSLRLLKALHQRWVGVLKGMKKEEFENSYLHSEGKKMWSLAKVVHLYAWHGKHHLGHLRILESIS